jgi:phage tail P2-like protein
MGALRMTDIKSLKLLDILPSSIAGDAQVNAMLPALDAELLSVTGSIREALISSRIDELPENVLNLLAWQWHVDFYEPEKLPVALKRNLIKSSILWHRKKGTLWAVKQILRDLGLEPTIREWFDIGSAPYTFGIDAVYKGNPAEAMTFLGDDTLKLLRLAVEVTKPARAGMLYLVVIPDMPGLDPSTHGCRYDYCAYAHGFLPGLELAPGPIGNPFEPDIAFASALEMSAHFKYPLWLSWDGFRYGDILPETGQRSSSAVSSSFYSDREAMEGYNTWRLRERWDGKSWADGKARIGGQCFVQVYPAGCAVYGNARYDALQAMESRYRHIPEPYRYDGSLLDSSQDHSGYEPINEYTTINVGSEADAAVTVEAASGSALIAWIASENESLGIGSSRLSLYIGFENEPLAAGSACLSSSIGFGNEPSATGSICLSLSIGFENEPLETGSNGYSLSIAIEAAAWEGLSASWDSDGWRPDRTWADKPPAVTADCYLTLTEVS